MIWEPRHRWVETKLWHYQCSVCGHVTTAQKFAEQQKQPTPYICPVEAEDEQPKLQR